MSENGIYPVWKEGRKKNGRVVGTRVKTNVIHVHIVSSQALFHYCIAHTDTKAYNSNNGAPVHM